MSTAATRIRNETRTAPRPPLTIGTAHSRILPSGLSTVRLDPPETKRRIASSPTKDAARGDSPVGPLDCHHPRRALRMGDGSNAGSTIRRYAVGAIVLIAIAVVGKGGALKQKILDKLHGVSGR